MIAATPDAAPSATIPLRIRFIILGALTLVVFVADIGTKRWVFDLLDTEIRQIDGIPRIVSTREPLVIMGDFPVADGRDDSLGGGIRLRSAFNLGAFSGWFGDHPWLLVVLALIALVVFPLLVWRLPEVGGAFTVSLGLLSGGTAGNLWDRIHFGGVRDFIEVWIPVPVGFFQPWPNFNIADCAITVGVIVLITSEFFGKKKIRESTENPAH